MLGIARITENGLVAAAVITAAIGFLGVMAFEVSVMLGLLLTPVCILFSSATLAFVLLRHQEQAAITTALMAASFVILASIVTQQYSTQVLMFTAICWLGAMLVSSVLRQTVSLKTAVLTVVPITVLVGVVTIVFKLEIVQFWQSLMLESVSSFSPAELEQIGPERLDVINVGMPEMLTNSLASWAFFIVLCSVFLGRYWQAQLFNPGGFQSEFHSLRLGREAVIAFAIAIALSLVFSLAFFGVIASALMFVFFIQGLSVVHCLIKQRGMSRSWLTGLYFVLWLPPSMLFLGALGMVDNFFRLRKF